MFPPILLTRDAPLGGARMRINYRGSSPQYFSKINLLGGTARTFSERKPQGSEDEELLKLTCVQLSEYARDYNVVEGG